jgi:hypothetical protein
MSDHHSLTYLLKQRNLSRHQARWTELLADFDLQFNYIKGEDNRVADALSWRDTPEEDPVIGPKYVACIASLSASSGTLSSAVQGQILKGYNEDPFCQALLKALPLRDDCRVSNGLLFVEDRMVIPADKDL